MSTLLKTLPMVEWKRCEPGTWKGKTESVDGAYVYEAVMMLSNQLEGWMASLYVNGVLVHHSEHFSRLGAQAGAFKALKRAIALREVM